MALSSDKTLAGPLSSSLGLEDLHDLLEVIRIDAHNAAVIRKREDQP